MEMSEGVGMPCALQFRGMDGPPMGTIDMKEGCRDENMNDGSGFGTGGGARIGEQNERSG